MRSDTRTGSRITFLVVVCLALPMFACSEASPTRGSPTVTAPVQDPVTVTDTPAIQDPTSTGGVPTVETPVDGDLSEEEILQIVRSSLAAFPWRLEQSVLSKETGQTIASLTEAQSSGRGHNQSVQTVGNETITIESILIDGMLYLKITGSPAETYGLVDGQWTEVPPDSPLAQLADTGAIDPAKIAEIFATDFAAISGESGIDALVFEPAGSDDLNGVPTTIYESKAATYTYRWWIGADGRFYKTTVDIPEAMRTILIQYDPSITIAAPLP